MAICDFLTTSVHDGTLPADDKESIDVAVNCISASFGVDPSDTAAVSEAIGDQNLLKVYSVYEKLKNASKPAGSAAQAAPAAAGQPAAGGPTAEQKKEAESLKSKGNAAMAQKQYESAIGLYSDALKLHPGNAIYLSNRAAAHSADKDHESAKADAEAAVAVDPNYTKAWSRLGLAKFALGDAKGSMEAYRQGIEHEGNGGSDAMKKGFETAKMRVAQLEAEEAAATEATREAGAGTPNLGDMFGGGGGGGGGMPDFGSIMNNPMFASMAQNLMSNPDLMNNLMSNPRLRDMASQFGSGGGVPDFSALMSDPNIADMYVSPVGGTSRSPSRADLT